MRKLLDFLFRKRHWLLFIILEVISVILIYNNHAYQRNILRGSANVVTGKVSSFSESVVSYLNLREINRELFEQNGKLELQLLELQDRMEQLLADSVIFVGAKPDSVEQFPYQFVMAKVVNNSVTHLSNYITIDKGRADGIETDMGVVSERGVVGVVSTVADHYAVVLPLLNPKSHLSCKVYGSNYFGTMSWNGRDPRFANLDELPRHVEFEIGDTIVTSGYSAIFPAGLIVGKVVNYSKQHDDNFYSLQVELATRFETLRYVRVIRNFNQAEQLNVEKEARRNDR